MLALYRITYLVQEAWYYAPTYTHGCGFGELLNLQFILMTDVNAIITISQMENGVWR